MAHAGHVKAVEEVAGVGKVLGDGLGDISRMPSETTTTILPAPARSLMTEESVSGTPPSRLRSSRFLLW